MKDTLHNRLIADILAANRSAKTKRFRRELCDALDGEELGLAEFVLGGERIGFCPDAFMVDPILKLVRVFEVEVTSHITLAKERAMYFLFEALDNIAWHMEVVVVNRHGQAALHPDFDDFERDYPGVEMAARC